MALSDADAATLAALRAVRSAIIAGKTPNKVQSGGRSVEYGPADLARLEGDIDALARSAVDGAPIRRRGALRFRIR